MTTGPADVAKVLKLGEGFYVRQEVDNIAWMDMGGWAIVVDALEQPHLAGEVFDAIASTVGDVPVRYVLNTHTHYDHVALNEAFERRFGAEIINQQATPLAGDGRWFAGPRRRAQMLAVPDCHTAEDCIVWAPDDKVLFVGDIFGWGLIPLISVLCDETAELLVKTYARLIEFDALVVVPGHGPMATTGDLRRWVEYFHWLLEGVAAACAAGGSDEDICAEMPPPDDMKSWWRFVQWKHADSVKKVIRGVRHSRVTRTS